jgi:hypothetical protein
LSHVVNRSAISSPSPRNWRERSPTR